MARKVRRYGALMRQVYLIINCTHRRFLVGIKIKKKIEIDNFPILFD